MDALADPLGFAGTEFDCHPHPTPGVGVHRGCVV